MSKKFLLTALLLVSFLFLGGTVQAATSSLTAAQTVANRAVGTDDQTATLASSTPNVLGIRASTTITVVTAPDHGETLVVGGCTITFVTNASTTLPLSCAAGTASMGVGDGANATSTAGLAATIIGSLGTNFPNVTASGTMLTISASSTNTSAVTFTAATSSTLGLGKILVTPNGAKILVASTAHSFAGTASVAEIDTITIAGTLDVDDVFGITSTSTTLTTAASYTVVAGDTLQLIADKIRNQIWASAASTTVGFTVATGTNTLVFTARRAGYGNTIVGTATNYAGQAQVVTFTPADVTSGYIFRMSINGRDYAFTAGGGATVASVVAGLVLAAAADPVATCTDTTTEVTCTAKTAGTAFLSYASSVSAPVVSVGSTAGGPAGGAPNVVVIPVKDNSLPVVTVTGSTLLTRVWSYGKTGKEVNVLQEKLKTLGYLKKTLKTTNYFGVLTKQGLIKFQKENKLKPYNGVLNAKTRALLNSL